jgi:sugar phosphate isomerase/epimerase
VARAIQKVHVSIPYRMLAENYLPLALEHGLNLEIGMDARSLDAYGRGHMRKTAGLLKKAEALVTLHAPFLDLSPGSPDPFAAAATKRRLSLFLSRAPLFNPLAVVYHTGWNRMFYGADEPAWHGRAVETTRWFHDTLRRETDAVLAIENVFERTPRVLVNLFGALDRERAGFCLDTGHVPAFSKTSLGDWLAALGDRLVELHIHDNRGWEDEHLAAGSGVADWNLLFAWLRESGRSPILTCEAQTVAGVWESLEFLGRRLGGDSA